MNKIPLARGKAGCKTCIYVKLGPLIQRILCVVCRLKQEYQTTIGVHQRLNTRKEFNDRGETEETPIVNPVRAKPSELYQIHIQSRTQIRYRARSCFCGKPTKTDRNPLCAIHYDQKLVREDKARAERRKNAS